MEIRWVVTFSSDDANVVNDALGILQSVLPYMVDNVEIQAVEVTDDNYYRVVQ